MTASVRPTYQAIVDQAVAATGAASAWLLRSADGGLVVAATAGVARTAIGSPVVATGAQGYVLSSGQPVALMPQPNDAANDGAAGYPGVPSSVLAAPCGTDVVVGLLELAAKDGSSPFSFADIEAVSTLAAVAGAAIAEDDGTTYDVASPAQLATELERLAADNPGRYADTARVIESLLGQRS